MGKLYKNYILSSFKEKFKFILIFLFSFFTIIIPVSGFALINKLQNIQNEIKSNTQDFSYVENIKTRTNSQTKKYITPISIFGNDSMQLNANGQVFNFSTFNFSKNLLNLEDYLKKIDLDFSNFNLLEVFNFDQDYVKDYELSTFKIYLEMFQNLNIFQNFKEYSDSFVNFWKEKGLDTLSVIDKYIQLNIEPNLTQNKIVNLTDKNLPIILITIDIDGNKTIDYTDVFNKGIGGFLGNFLNVKIINEDNQTEEYKITYAFGIEYNSYLNDSIKAVDIGGLTIENLYQTTWYANEEYGYLNLDFMSIYFDLISQKFKFKFNYKNELYFYDTSKNMKIKFIDRTNLINKNFKSYNSVKIKYYETADFYNEYYPNYVVVNPVYAQNNSLKAGDQIIFETNESTLSWSVGAIGTSYDDYFPIINESSFIPNYKNEMFIYINRNLFGDSNKILSNSIVDESKILLNYYGNNRDEDLQKFIFSLKSNPLDVLDNGENTTINFKKTNSTFFTLKDNSILYLKNSLIIIFSTIFIIFLLISITSIFVLVKKNIKLNMVRIGILKATGVKNSTISICYILNLIFPCLIGIFIGYISMFGLQYYLLNIVSKFFNIWNNFDFFILGFLIISFIYLFLVILFTLISTKVELKRNVVLLLNNIEKNTRFKFKETNKLKSKNYYWNISKGFLRTSKLKTTVFLTVASITALLSTMAVMIPIDVNDIKNNFYDKTTYNNYSEYQLGPINNPLNFTSIYNEHDEESMIPEYYKDLRTGQILETKNIDPNETISGDYDIYFSSEITNWFGFNLLSLINKGFSINSLDKTTKTFQICENNICKDQTDLSSLIDLIFKTLVPEMLNLDVSTAIDWKAALSMTAINFMPPSMLDTWNNEQKRNSFQFDIQRTKYNKDTDDLVTNLNAKTNDTNFKLIGINKDQKSFKIDQQISENSLIISKKFSDLINKKKSDKISFQVKVPNMSYLNNKGEYKELDFKDWYYFENDKLTNLDEMDLSKFTLLNPKLNVGNVETYYKNKNGELVPYNKVQNIVLKIDKSEINKSEFDSLFSNDQILIDDFSNDFYLIRAYDWRYSIGDSIKSIYDLLSSRIIPKTFIDSAYDVKNEKNLTFLKNIDKTIEEQFVITDVIDIYDKNIALVSRNSLNKIIGADVFNINQVSSDNKWFNGKMSLDKSEIEIMSRFGITSSNSVLTIDSLINGANNLSKNYDFLGRKTELIDQIYDISFLIVIVFLLITLFASIISIIMISNLFIDENKKIIATFKSFGYSNFKINRMLLQITYPLILISILIFSLIPQIGVYAISNILENNLVYLPINLNIWLPIVMSIILNVIFISTYYLVFKILINQNIQKQLTL